MATNQMRREAAKRKLERQQERRAQQAKRRQRVAVITSVAVVVVVVVGVVLLSTLNSGGTPPAADPAVTAAPTAEPTTEPPPAALGTCTFAPSAEAAAKPAPVPTVTTAATSGTVPATLQTDRGAIPMTLDRSTGPCAVESFVSLTNAGYFNGTVCHRLTTGESLKVLQCGDPTGAGTGGPGYTINDEPPTALAPGPDGTTVIYPRGTVAMAKTAAPNSGGSQFFLVYADSFLPPDYTVFGTIGEAGLATLDAVAQGGADDANGPGDGAPRTPVTIQTATVG